MYTLVFKKKDNSKGFYLHIRLGHLVIEYDYLNSFVPYMGYQKKAKRNIKIHLKKEGEYPVDLQESWDVREIENVSLHRGGLVPRNVMYSILIFVLTTI